jgi:hypothetical protein
MMAQRKRLKARGIMVDVAYELHRYIKWRAGREGVGYGLSPEFFRAAIDAGTANFFGVECDDGLIEDRQKPELFREWKDRRAQLTEHSH